MAREQIEVIRLLIRVMKDMKQISIEKFVKINQGLCQKKHKRIKNEQKLRDTPRLLSESFRVVNKHKPHHKYISFIFTVFNFFFVFLNRKQI
jgi:hypothetical protein